MGYGEYSSAKQTFCASSENKGILVRRVKMDKRIKFILVIRKTNAKYF